ncbi:hypothetical protein Hanom_Chr11g01002401 [Helianthus anomalus]
MFTSNFRRCPFGQKLTGGVLYLSKSYMFCPLGQTLLKISVKKMSCAKHMRVKWSFPLISYNSPFITPLNCLCSTVNNPS